MPLLDHFHPPLDTERAWESFHSFWCTSISQDLNQSYLPERFVALPQIKMGIQVEADVATLEKEELAEVYGNGGVVTAVYTPPHPPLTVPVDFTDLDTFEVQIYKEEGGLKLVGAVELVSPANKDRPSHRQAFAMKCASYLQRGVSILVVDVVTEKRGNLHAEILGILEPDLKVENPDPLYAAAYRTIARDNKVILECWPDSLHLGKNLPQLPLWIGPDLAVPINLEQTYRTTCTGLRIRLPATS